jgi:succinate-semialdehyde dehydrogenase / glutarate-semialdehyde dehydrogenase
VQEAIYERFTTTFGEKAKQIKVGDGLDLETQMGPVANDRRLAAMEAGGADRRRPGQGRARRRRGQPDRQSRLFS